MTARLEALGFSMSTVICLCMRNKCMLTKNTQCSMYNNGFSKRTKKKKKNPIQRIVEVKVYVPLDPLLMNHVNDCVRNSCIMYNTNPSGLRVNVFIETFMLNYLFGLSKPVWRYSIFNAIPNNFTLFLRKINYNLIDKLLSKSNKK